MRPHLVIVTPPTFHEPLHLKSGATCSQFNSSSRLHLAHKHPAAVWPEPQLPPELPLPGCGGKGLVLALVISQVGDMVLLLVCTQLLDVIDGLCKSYR